MHNRSCQHAPRSWRVAACLMTAAMSLFVVPVAHAASARTALALHLAFQQTGTVITGQVIDQNTKQGVPGVTVQVEGTRLAAITNDDGRFTIPNVAAGTVTLIARRIGYAPQRNTVTVAATGRVTSDFVLQPAATSLQEVIVTGTAGGQQRREIGNSVPVINAPDVLSKSAAPTVTSLLNARAPGVTIFNNTGRLGSGPNINIRGIASLGLDNNPLIYIDGVRVSNATGTGPTTFGNGGFGSQNAGVGGRLNDITPEDIERIEIIKGPAAATIYGTEAANGVIQIITKKGASGRPRLNVVLENGSIFFRDPQGRFPTNFFPDGEGNIVPFNAVKAEDALGTPLFRTGWAQRYGASLAGGIGTGNYSLASDYQNEKGIEPNNSVEQFSGHANLSLAPSSKVDFATSLNFVRGTNHLGADVGVSTMAGGEFAHPLIFSVPGAHGFFPNVPPEVPQQLFDNFVEFNRFTGSATLNHQPVGWFSQHLIVGLDYTGEDGRGLEKFAPPRLAPFTLGNAAGRLGQTLTRTSVASLDYRATAKATLTPAWTSSTTIGGQLYRTQANQSFLGGIGFPGPGIETISGTSLALQSLQGDTTNTTIGGYVQEEFALNDRLYLTGALRVDNNSAFGKDFRLITYPKASASWVVSEEPFWNVPWVNSLKLRAAFGESGRAPAAFTALRTFQPVQGPGGSNAFTAGSFGNPDLKPERGKEFETGFEADLFDRLHLDFTWYDKHTKNEIVAQDLAPSGGFSGTQFRNLGQVNNNGVELQATLQVLRGENFEWEVAGNWATAHNKVTDLGGLPSLITSFGQFNQVGFPIQSFFSRRVVSATLDPNTGAVTEMLCDGGAGQGPVDCATAPFEFIGTPTPTSFGSIGNTFTLFKKLRLYALVDWKHGNKIYANTEEIRCIGLAGAPMCDVNYHPLNYDPIYAAEASTSAFVLQAQDRFFQDASFVKLREVSATYTLPERLIPGFQSASITLAARELGLWTDYNGIDPEVNQFATGLTSGDQGVTPPLSRIVATLNLSF